MLLGIAGGYLSQGLRGNQRNEEQQVTQKDATPPVVAVGDYVVTAGMVDRLAEQNNQRTGQQTPSGVAINLASALGEEVDAGLTYKLMRENGVQMTDEAILKSIKDQLEQSKEVFLIQMRMQMVQAKQISQNASDEEFRAKLKEQGRDPDKIIADQVSEIATQLKDPGKRALLEVQAGRTMLMDKLATKIQVSDDELKKGYDQLVLKRIVVGPSGTTPAATRAKDALKAIDSGTSFAAVMNQYSTEKPEKGKAVADLSINSPRKDLAASVQAAIKNLKPGQHTAILNEMEGPTIYQLVSEKPNVPKDFDTKKEADRMAYQKSQVGDQLKKRFDDLKKSDAIQWKEPVYQALYRFQSLLSDPARVPDDAKDKAELKAIADACKDAKADDESVVRAAALTRYIAVTSLYAKSNVAERTAMADERIDAISKVLQFVESSQDRVDLAELYINKKNGKDAAESLYIAANQNINDMQNLVASHELENRIEELEVKLNGLSGVTDDQKKSLEKAIKDYQDAYKEAREAQRKEEEERRKAEEEDKKNAAKPTPSAAPSASPSAPTTTTNGATIPGMTPGPLPSAPGK